MKRSLELIFKEDVQRIFDHFSFCFGMPIVFLMPTGEIARIGANMPDAEYCQLLRNRLGRSQACEDDNHRWMKEAAQRGEMVCYTCHAGLTEAIKPIYFDGTLIGFILIGQFRSEERIPEAVIREWRRYHPSEQLEAAYASLRHVPQKQINAVLDLFSILVDHLVSQRMITLKGSVDLQEILAYMGMHLRERLSLPEVARTFYKSPSTVSHIFERKLGKSFRQTLVEMRLSKAEQYMIENPEISVTKAAASVGYSDPYYFSRIYARYRGTPPSKFLKQCRLPQQS